MAIPQILSKQILSTSKAQGRASHHATALAAEGPAQGRKVGQTSAAQDTSVEVCVPSTLKFTPALRRARLRKTLRDKFTRRSIHRICSKPRRRKIAQDAHDYEALSKMYECH